MIEIFLIPSNSKNKPTESLIFSVGFLIIVHIEAEKSYTNKIKVGGYSYFLHFINML